MTDGCPACPLVTDLLEGTTAQLLEVLRSAGCATMLAVGVAA